MNAKHESIEQTKTSHKVTQRNSNLLSVLQCRFKVDALIFERLKSALGFNTPARIIKHYDVIASWQDVDFVSDQNAGS